MVVALMDKTTKKVTYDEASIADLSESQQIEAQRALDLVNRLMGDLVNYNGETPPLPTPQNVTKNISVVVVKFVKTATENLQKSPPNFEEAVKLLTNALEAALRRPLWEPTAVALEEVAKILGLRCDAYNAWQKFPEAYADASMSAMLFPNDPMAYFRKAMLLTRAMKYNESKMLLEQALDMAPGNKIIRDKLIELTNLVQQQQAANVIPDRVADTAPVSQAGTSSGDAVKVSESQVSETKPEKKKA